MIDEVTGNAVIVDFGLSKVFLCLSTTGLAINVFELHFCTRVPDKLYFMACFTQTELEGTQVEISQCNVSL